MADSDALVLSKAEVRALTRTPVRARQIDFLVRNGIRHYVDGHGCPVVLRAAVEGGPLPRHTAGGWAPNKAR